MSSDIYPPPIVPTHQGPPRGPGSSPMPPRWPAVITPAPPPGRGRHAPGDSPHPSAPTGQPPCGVTPNTPSPTGQFPLLAPLAAARAPPTKATQPTGSPSSPLAGAPLEGEPLWHHRATRGLPGVGCPPGARPSTTPARAGVVHHRPRDTPCRRRAPALTLRACQRPAVPAAHPPPVRERRAPCPVRLAQSCLSTYPPTPFGSKMVNVV